MAMSAPKAFISYCWTNPQHEQWVINLATQLRENGVDVILDKWDLREGQDAVAFMERMVTDPNVLKVLMIFDRMYAEKADKRAGGVGTETQIISSKVYNSVDQTKFVGVLSELNADGEPFTPAYYKSRIHIDLSSEEIYPSNFDQLLRWVFDKPLYIKPTLGKRPEFLGDQAVVLGTNSRARRAKDLIQSGALTAGAALDDYLSTFASELEKFRIVKSKDKEFDDQVIESIDTFLPYRNEYIEIIAISARYWKSEFVEHLHRFMERVSVYQFRPVEMNQYSNWDFDNFCFIANELFLYTIAILIRSERPNEAAELLAQQFYLGEAAPNQSEPMKDFIVFNQHVVSLDHRNQRLSLRRLSLHADLVKRRSQVSGVPFRDLMQADFVLFLRDLLTRVGQWGRWQPFTLIYAGRTYSPFEIFARARSSGYFSSILPLLGAQYKAALDSLMVEFQQGKREAPRWEFDSFDPLILSNWEKLASAP
jgi:hypothetical protein